MPNSQSAVAEAPPALAAFLRGVERRGALFSELQCGRSDAGDTALAAAMRVFRTQAAALPMADWPQRFWTLLVATPQLRGTLPGAAWPPGTEALSGIEPMPRQALLLRLAAGLDEVAAAAVLQLDEAHYRQAVAMACPRDAAGHPDVAAWRRLAETLQQHLRELPAPRLARLAELREAALSGGRLQPPHVGNAPTPAAPGPAPVRIARGGRQGWLLLVVVLLAAVVAAVWYWPWLQWLDTLSGQGGGGAAGGVAPLDVVSEALPLETAAARFDRAFALAHHPDASLLLDPEAQTIAQEADFYAWFAAGQARAAEPTTPTATASQRIDTAGTHDAQR